MSWLEACAHVQVLLLLPMRHLARRAVLRLCQLAQQETRSDSIQGKARFLEEFGDAPLSGLLPCLDLSCSLSCSLCVHWWLPALWCACVNLAGTKTRSCERLILRTLTRELACRARGQGGQPEAGRPPGPVLRQHRRPLQDRHQADAVSLACMDMRCHQQSTLHSSCGGLPCLPDSAARDQPRTLRAWTWDHSPSDGERAAGAQ